MLSSQDKAILLLDEPTSHLDSQSQNTVLQNLFRTATENNQSVLMVAHRLETAVTFCDKTLVLEMGEVRQFDKPIRLLVEDISDTKVNK